MSDLNLKDIFITEELKTPLAELEELNSKLRKKKAEVKKAIFFSKHPELLMAKKEVEAVKSEKSVHAFNEAVKADVQQAITETPKQEPVKTQSEPVKLVEPPKTLRVGLGQRWLL